MIRVLLVDDHAIVRSGLRMLLDTTGDIQVVGEAGEGGEGVRLAQELKPDVILMDLSMPRMDGVAATSGCLAVSPASKVVVLTSSVDDSSVIPALQAGALSYLLKRARIEQVIAVIREAAEGIATLDPLASERLRRTIADVPAVRTTQEKRASDQLSQRETEVLRLVAQGRSNKEIAERLWISERTVKAHVSSLLAKLSLTDRTQLAIYAVERQLTGT